MNHRRRRPKHQRAGCLWCKPHKDERAPKTARSPAAAAVLSERPQRERLGCGDTVERYGSLLVDPGDFMLDVDYWDDFCCCDERHVAEPHYDATPLRVTLAEVAA